jgi:hypothetical protein
VFGDAASRVTCIPHMTIFSNIQAMIVDNMEVITFGMYTDVHIEQDDFYESKYLKQLFEHKKDDDNENFEELLRF